ncbi:hypothetical protein [Roseibium hamelinense]|uniref:hypothetical protein n=1 Tax=Roseibium hamelinense TaxID=150831 RepID=UPI001AD8FFA2|nr:hypothetical protein [Roseibium hamelinense]
MKTQPALWWARIVGALWFALAVSLSGAAMGQDVPLPPKAKPDPNAPIPEPETPIQNLLDREPEPLFSDTLVPYAPATGGNTGFSGYQDQGALYLMAKLTRDTQPIESGLIWRIYSETMNTDGRLELVATARGGDAEFRLDPGSYLIHTAYGHATATNRIVIGRDVQSKMVILNAGGIKLDAALADDTPLVSPELRFDIYGTEFNERGERNLIAENVQPDKIIRLAPDTYHIVSNYGSANAIVRADVQVIPGRLTEATIYHNAADITLKLVNEEGGEAIANTSWSVLSPGGDVVVEANGAFPDFVLAAGEYEVVARNNGRLFQRTFVVEAGLNREVEVLARVKKDSQRAGARK